MSNSQKKIDKKQRIYQVAKEFHLSNEELICFLKENKYRVRNHMSPISEKMYEFICSYFEQEETQAPIVSDYKKKLEEKKIEEEARKQAIQQEINDIIERSKGPVIPISKKKRKEIIPVEKKIEEIKEVKSEVKDIKKKEEKKKEAVLIDEKKISAEKETEKVKKKHKRHLKRIPAGLKKKIAAAEEDKKKKAEKDDVRKREIDKDKKDRGFKKKKKRGRKRKTVQIDEREIEASIKQTLAKMSDPTKKKRYKKERKVEDEEVQEKNILTTTEFATVAELSNLMEVESSEIITSCMSLGIMVTINQRLDSDTITMVADEFDYEVQFETEYGEDSVEQTEEEEEDISLLKERPPVVTVMGHVDHGKTSLLDYIRQTNVIADESGGITQHIGAYEIEINSKKIIFLDTPGHAAFTAMRARGAQITDIVILVVAADDGVMPQTVEAINHAKAAGDSGVPIIVAINKIDKSGANADNIRKQMSEHDVLVEEWGGKVQSVELSAKTGQGIDKLVEKILLEAEMLELKANPKAKPKGVVIEAKMTKGKGIVSTLLIQKGTLKVGDIFVAGQFNGRVRAMLNEKNKKIKEAGPSIPVQVLGFTGAPQAGDSFVVVDSEQEAKEICQKRQQLKREQNFRQVRRITLDQISKQIAEGKLRELSIIIKGDVDGSVEAIADALMALSTDEVGVLIVHKAVGIIVESDILLAQTSNAVIIGFHVSLNPKARDLAKEENVDIRQYEVIYDIVNDVTLALSGLLEPERNEENIGRVEVREVFKSSRTGVIAGCYILEGKVKRNDLVRLIRDGDMLYDGKISSLKRFKDDVKEVTSGYECGIVLDNYDDVIEGDQMELYKIVETARSL